MIADKVIVALDNMNRDEAKSFLKKCNKSIKLVKVGMELFYKEGPDLLTELNEEFGVKIFLDLKLHDIPSTVHKAIRSLEGLPISLLTIHMSGGKEMVKEAIKARDLYLFGCKLLGVTYLTSLDESNFKELWGIEKEQIPTQYERLFKLACQNKIDGIVLSAMELQIAKNIESKNDHSLIKVCPGIRFRDEIIAGDTGDQKRVMNPFEAISHGANYLVIGRSLTKTSDLTLRLKQLNNNDK